MVFVPNGKLSLHRLPFLIYSQSIDKHRTGYLYAAPIYYLVEGDRITLISIIDNRKYHKELRNKQSGTGKSII